MKRAYNLLIGEAHGRRKSRSPSAPPIRSHRAGDGGQAALRGRLPKTTTSPPGNPRAMADTVGAIVEAVRAALEPARPAFRRPRRPRLRDAGRRLRSSAASTSSFERPACRHPCPTIRSPPSPTHGVSSTTSTNSTDRPDFWRRADPIARQAVEEHRPAEKFTAVLPKRFDQARPFANPGHRAARVAPAAARAERPSRAPPFSRSRPRLAVADSYAQTCRPSGRTGLHSKDETS